MKKLFNLLLLISICFFATPVFADGKWEGTCVCFNGQNKFQISCKERQKGCQTLCNENNANVSNDKCTYKQISENNGQTSNSSSTGGSQINCGVISDITRPLAKIIMIAGPILLIIMGTIDILGVVTSGDEKGMKNAWNKLLKRFIICILLFLLPLIINIIIGWTSFNDLSACL